MIPPRILIVEDNILIADDVASFLRTYGYAVAGEAPSIERGLEIVAGGGIDGALVDIDLAGEPSIPVCQALQAKGVPFAFLTGYYDHPVLSEFRQAPQVIKPPDPPHLLAALHAVVPRDVELGNALLDRLEVQQKATVRTVLERVTLEEGDLLASPDQPCAHAYFPIDALISIHYGQPGRSMEVALVGRRSGMAFAPFLGATRAPLQTTVLIGGEAWRVPETILERITAHYPALRRHFADHFAGLLRQAMETAVFAARASIVQRVAHWLIRATQESGTSRLALTHEALAKALSVRRASVTLALQELEGLGMIRSKRGYVVIGNRERLRELVNPSWTATQASGVLCGTVPRRI